MKVTNLGTKDRVSCYIATELYQFMAYHPDARLGLATGGTMIEMYAHLVDLLNKNALDVSRIHTFNLDEYVGLEAAHPESYNYYMHHILFNRYPKFTEAFLHIPNGDVTDVYEEAKRYEAILDQEGPIDIQILGIGQNGHIGFNEPGTSFDTETHCVNLTESTIEANSRYFDHKDDVPRQAISMGLQSIMKAKRIILIALGASKREAMTRLMTGEITPDLPASILHQHPYVDVFVDDEAMPLI
ncbi:glucosamine-6-phosphate deaminase [Staphylococcus hyicus]|uniref:glucosamine-6-phosphate deaminase n=1 Tax=Staphylococcus hyicus TaxID=1284 RepID=UPI00208F54DB|nr:glucosamine-6-phosphate deaminase [Staphylococcus hyicus]MCO4329103.1 glucosamine-6-phosphate deaminase [Staphylococcus hyicus]MCO4332486.1 glucosamine-6-phosphate deaminase [Staphylococcus hyicus]MCO4334886.1 glucosamine-6-phosphate deaminase [Staphylococcus hyicus]MCO4335362.1 glucosamine-6-phosphate deaminase [Staphylococcus hyicus]